MAGRRADPAGKVVGLKLLQHRIVPSGCLAKRSTIGQDMHSPRASVIEQSAARQRTLLRAWL
jgi:hypothetical protein